MPIWDADFHRVNAERVKEREEVDADIAGFTGVPRPAAALYADVMPPDETPEMLNAAVEQWRRHVEAMNTALDQSIRDLNALFEGLASRA